MVAAPVSPTVEQECWPAENGRNVCEAKIYSDNVFFQAGGQWVSVQQGTSLAWNDSLQGFVLSFPQGTAVIVPFLEKEGQKMYANDLQTMGLAASSQPVLTESRFQRKFAWEIAGLPDVADSQPQAFGFEVTPLTEGLTIEERGDGWDFGGTIHLSFADLLQSGFVQDRINANEARFTKVSANVVEGRLSLDPTIRLSSGNVSVDYYSSDNTAPRPDYVFLIKWNITGVPAGATVHNSTMCFYYYSDQEFVADSDLNLTRIENQTWTWANKDTALLRTQTNNQSSDPWTFPDGGGPAALKWWCANATRGFKVDYGLGNTFSSWWFEDPDAYFNQENTPVESGDLYFGRSLSPAIFASSSYANVSIRPYLNVTYDAEANPPVVNLSSPLNGSEIGDKWLTQNFSAYVSDASNISSVRWWSDFRNGTWRLELSNTTNMPANPQQYNFSFNFSNWSNGGVITTVNLSNSNGRALSGNSTHFFMSSYQDDQLRWFYRNGTYITNFSLPPTNFITDQDVNATHMVFVDGVLNALILAYQNGTYISNCSLGSLSAGVPMGVAFAPDNTTVWVSYDDATERVFHTNFACANLQNWTLPDSNPGYLTINANNLSWMYDFFTYPDQVMAINLTDGSNPYNITSFRIYTEATSELNTPGLFVDKWDSYPEHLYTTIASPTNRLLSVMRKFAGNLTWNVVACDVYSNCAFNATNYTFYFDLVVSNETLARQAIVDGVNQVIPAADKSLGQRVYLRFDNGTQKNGKFDVVAVFGTQTWAFNYLTGSESYAEVSSLRQVVNAWQNTSLTYSQIVGQVAAYINQTKQ